MVNRTTIEKALPSDSVVESDKDTADKKIVPEVDREVVVKFEESKKLFEDLYNGLKLYKGQDLKLFQLERKGDNLRDKFKQLRDALESGGAIEKSHQDRLLESVVKIADKKNKSDFWQEVSDHGKMVAGSDLEEFYSKFINGLKKQLEAKEQAKAA